MLLYVPPVLAFKKHCILAPTSITNSGMWINEIAAFTSLNHEMYLSVQLSLSSILPHKEGCRLVCLHASTWKLEYLQLVCIPHCWGDEQLVRGVRDVLIIELDSHSVFTWNRQFQLHAHQRNSYHTLLSSVGYVFLQISKWKQTIQVFSLTFWLSLFMIMHF